MDFRQITMMQKIKSGMDRFRAGREKLLYQCQAESR